MKRLGLVLMFCALAPLVAAGAARPVARILQVTGTVTIRDSQQKTREARAYGTVYGGEKLRLAADSLVVLGFRHDGHMERLRAPVEVAVTEEGCKPNKAVEVLNVPKRHRDLVCRGIRELPAITQGAVAMAHTGYSKVLGPWLRPVNGSTILTAEPKLSWPSVSDAVEYQVEVYADEVPVRFARTKETQIDFASAPPLRAGVKYRWTVTASLRGKTVQAYEATFTVATDEQKKELAELMDIAAVSEIPVLALAAKRLEQTGFFAEAIPVYQRLVKLAPDSEPFRAALEGLYDRAIPARKAAPKDQTPPPVSPKATEEK